MASEGAPAVVVPDKKGNGRRFANYQRDALFFPEFRAIREAAYAVAGEGTSVTTSIPHSPLSPISTYTPPPTSSRFIRFVGSKSNPKESHLVAARRPAMWRDLTPWMQAYYRHHAGYALGPVYGFSLNLDPQIEQKAREQSSAAVWLQKRIARELRRLVPGEAPTFWFVIEQISRYRHLHVHGEIVTNDDTLSRRALRLAGGEWERVRQHQAHTTVNPDDGWIGYSFKDLAYNSNGLFAAGRHFSGEPVASTLNLTRLASQLYDQDRMKVLAGV